ncbi:MAG: PfkB family carbohydrate kinase [Gammaproteobacteria bacterium]|nr:PfkB family carbohydrate kinase [Gammaproteobacteria bacterium]MDH3428975.1 PfkB family carbohydrate kinase [Gammaproteobacteria bacterium]
MTSREQQILALIRENPMTRQQAIASTLGISRSAVAGHIMNLTNKGLIKGRGYVLSDPAFVAVIGGANMDIHGRSDETLRSNDSNPGVVHTSAGGVARNIAEGLARLGIDCRLVSAVGNDQHGRMLLRLGREAGIDMQYVQQFESAATSTYLSVLDNTGDMRVAVADMSIIDKLTANRLQQIQPMLNQASLIILDTNLPDDALAWLAHTFARHTIFADTVSTAKALRIKPYLSSIHTLKTSAIEAEALTGRKARTQADLRSLAGWVHAQGVERLFVTRGAQGVFYSTGDAQGVDKLKGPRRDVRNAGGAGDAFLATLAYAWLEDWPLDKSLQYALAAADLTLSDPATSSPALSLTAIHQTVENQHAG